jgi:hypothetical protein
MKNLRTFLTLAVGVFSIAVITSCSDDEGDIDQTASISFPNTISFSSITDYEFMMWTNSAEISTAGLSLENYIDSEDFYELSAASYKATGPITFTEDSIFLNTESGNEEGYPYFISNDSLYVVVAFINSPDTVIENSFLGIGGPTGVVINQGYLQYVENDQNGASTTSILQSGHFTLVNALDDLGLNSVGEIEAGDTLIIVNQNVNFF